MSGHEGKKGSGCLVILLIVSVFVNIFLIGCNKVFTKDSGKESLPIAVSQGNEQSVDIQVLRELAMVCGVKNTLNMGPLALISEMRVQLGNKQRFYGKTLSEQEQKTLQGLLADDPALLSKINSYDAFIQKINGKSFVIVP